MAFVAPQKRPAMSPGKYLKRSQSLMRRIENRLGMGHTPWHEMTMPQLLKKPVHERVFHTMAYTSDRMESYLNALSKNCGTPVACRKVDELRGETLELAHRQSRVVLGMIKPGNIEKEMRDGYKQTSGQFVKILKLLHEHPELAEGYRQYLARNAK